MASTTDMIRRKVVKMTTGDTIEFGDEFKNVFGDTVSPAYIRTALDRLGRELEMKFQTRYRYGVLEVVRVS